MLRYNQLKSRNFDDLDLLEVKVNGLNSSAEIFCTRIHSAKTSYPKDHIISFPCLLDCKYAFGDIAFCKFSDL